MSTLSTPSSASHNQSMFDRRNHLSHMATEDLVPTPLYEAIKHRTTRAERALDSVTEILRLMELPVVAWQLKGKMARGGFNLMPEDENTPPEMAAKLAYTELQTLRLRLMTLVNHPPMPSRQNPDPLNSLIFSAEEEINILHAIRREASAYLLDSPNDGTFHELKNLCQLALGNLQQMVVQKHAAGTIL